MLPLTVCEYWNTIAENKCAWSHFRDMVTMHFIFHIVFTLISFQSLCMENNNTRWFKSPSTALYFTDRETSYEKLVHKWKIHGGETVQGTCPPYWMQGIIFKLQVGRVTFQATIECFPEVISLVRRSVTASRLSSLKVIQGLLHECRGPGA